MAKRKDWVPCRSYGTGLLINPGELRFVPLYTLPDAAVDDVNVVEDASDALFMYRIVGDFTGAIPDPTVSFHNWGIRIMPVQGDIDSGDLDPPVNIVTSDLDNEAFANLRWWGERRRHDAPPFLQLYEDHGTFSHPHWTHIDLKPRQAFGQKMNLWPALVIWNGSADDMRFEHRFRSLVGYT